MVGIVSLVECSRRTAIFSGLFALFVDKESGCGLLREKLNCGW